MPGKQNIKQMKPIQSTKIIFSPVVKKAAVKADSAKVISKSNAKPKSIDDVKIKSFRVVDSTKAGSLRKESEVQTELNIKEEDF